MPVTRFTISSAVSPFQSRLSLSAAVGKLSYMLPDNTYDNCRGDSVKVTNTYTSKDERERLVRQKDLYRKFLLILQSSGKEVAKNERDLCKTIH